MKYLVVILIFVFIDLVSLRVLKKYWNACRAYWGTR
jgi:hypothetical protein